MGIPTTPRGTQLAQVRHGELPHVTPSVVGLDTLLAVVLVAALAPAIVAVLPGKIPQVVVLISGGILSARRVSASDIPAASPCSRISALASSS